MEPEIKIPNESPEHLSEKGIDRSVERALSPNNREAPIDTGAERLEQVAEANAVIADIGLTTAPPPIAADDTSVVTNTTIQSNPLVAKDDDLIEMEWVNKAKKIVADTKNDPHLQEEEVSKLQVDYLKKRFGRELGDAA